MRETELKRSHHRLAGLRCADNQRLDFRKKPFADFHRLKHGIQMFLVENAPRSHGELHHRHQCMSLGRTYDEILVYRASGKEGCETAAADHVRAGVPVAHEVSSHHFRYQHLDGVPVVSLVMQTLYDGLAAVAPACTVLVVGVFVGIVGESLAVFVGLEVSHRT